MKSFSCLVVLASFASILSLFTASTAHAQWRTETYSLKGGWNSIYLHGAAPTGTIESLLDSGDALKILEIWRWNPNPNQVQFNESPQIPTPGTPEWSVWRRDDPAESTLSTLTAPSAYLIKCDGLATASLSVPLTLSPLPPDTAWVRNGANLLSFPTLQTGNVWPSFGAYFASFPAAIAANTAVYKYVGGPLGPVNPIQVFSPVTESLVRNQAYWFDSKVVGDFHGPLDISLSTASGLTFGRDGSLVTARIRNRTAAPISITLTPVNSDAAPTGETPISGPVPLSLRTFNTTTLLYDETPITAALTQAIAPQTTAEITFGINRAAMSAAEPDALFASFLRVTESSSLMDVYLPATALKGTLAGLWVGDIILDGVTSLVPGSVDTTTPRPFPLRTILHVADDASSTTRLLSQVFIGQLDTAGNPPGLCTSESRLFPAGKATSQRLTAAHLPLDQVIATGNGSVSVPGVLTRTVTIPFNDPTNPFVHQYHPDHDNKNPRGANLPAGIESFNISRDCTFTFTAAPPTGSTTSSGWGSRIIGGTYSETITGLHKNPITLTGTFELRRASESGTLITN